MPDRTPPNEPPPWPQVGGPLDEVNAAFHTAYDGAREEAEEDAALLVLLGDVLVVQRGEARHERPVTPPLYHALKSVSHAPAALFALLHPLGDGPLDSRTRERLAALGARTRAALGTLARDAAGDAEAQAAMRALLEATGAEVERTLGNGRASREALGAYARTTGPALLALVDHATRVQLAALHAAVEEALAPMTDAERGGLQVVVAGAHQARERSLGMLYFQKRLGEEAGREERVAYAENVTDADQAVALVGTRRLDRAIARAFFGDARRLQRDVLGDAAAAHLSRMSLPGPPAAAPRQEVQDGPGPGDDARP
jgi:hypothetical protein